MLDSDSPYSNEEYGTHQVYEQLQDGEVGTYEIGNQYSWNYDSKSRKVNLNYLGFISLPFRQGTFRSFWKKVRTHFWSHKIT